MKTILLSFIIRFSSLGFAWMLVVNLCLISGCWVLFVPLNAQNQNNEARNWCLADSIGLKFETNGTITQFKTSIDNPGNNPFTVSASISDSIGNLLLYFAPKNDCPASAPCIFTNKVYNARNEVLINGDTIPDSNLVANASAIFLKKPFQNNGKYVLLTLVYKSHHTAFDYRVILYAHEIDILSDSGRGRVTQRNIVVLDSIFRSGCNVIKHADGEKWWIIMPTGTNKIIVYLYDGDSFVRYPDQNTNNVQGSNCAGAFKFSLRGDYFFRPESGIVQSYDFNRCTGKITAKNLNFPYHCGLKTWGISHAEQNLYYICSQTNKFLYRYNTITQQRDSFQVFPGGVSDYFLSMEPNLFGTELFFPNYDSVHNGNYLAAILNADSAQPNIALNYLYLDGRRMKNFIPEVTNYGLGRLVAKAAFLANLTGNPLEVAFEDSSTGSITAWAWSFGDGLTSNARNPTHSYAAPGTYAVRLIVYNCVGADTVIKNIVVGGVGMGLPDNEAITIKPNPTTGLLVIEVGAAAENPVEAVILSLFGQELLKTKLTGKRQTVDLSSLPDGVYLLQINSNQRVMKTQKIMISK